MKKGFALLELLIATLITSMITTGLLTALYLATRAQLQVDESTNEIMRASLVQRVLTRDISGIFLPAKVAEQEDEEKQKKEKEAAQKEEKKEDVPVKKVFYATTKDGKLDTLTFITNNPMQVFWGPVEQRPVPHVARVVYRLEKDKKRKNAFILTRQEGESLDFEQYKRGEKGSPRIYELIDGIKDLTLTFFAEIPEKDEKKEDAKKEKKKRVFKEFKSWQEQKKDDTKLPLGPKFVEVKLVLWDGTYKNEVRYFFTASILSDMTLPEKPVQKQLTLKDLFAKKQQAEQQQKAQAQRNQTQRVTKLNLIINQQKV